MRSAVNFDNETLLAAGEIHEILLDRELAEELKAAEVAISQLEPKRIFG